MSGVPHENGVGQPGSRMCAAIKEGLRLVDAINEEKRPKFFDVAAGRIGVHAALHGFTSNALAATEIAIARAANEFRGAINHGSPSADNEDSDEAWETDEEGDLGDGQKEAAQHPVSVAETRPRGESRALAHMEKLHLNATSPRDEDTDIERMFGTTLLCQNAVVAAPIAAEAVKTHLELLSEVFLKTLSPERKATGPRIDVILAEDYLVKETNGGPLDEEDVRTLGELFPNLTVGELSTRSRLSDRLKIAKKMVKKGPSELFAEDVSETDRPSKDLKHVVVSLMEGRALEEPQFSMNVPEDWEDIQLPDESIVSAGMKAGVELEPSEDLIKSTQAEFTKGLLRTCMNAFMVRMFLMKMGMESRQEVEKAIGRYAGDMAKLLKELDEPPVEIFNKMCAEATDNVRKLAAKLINLPSFQSSVLQEPVLQENIQLLGLLKHMRKAFLDSETRGKGDQVAETEEEDDGLSEGEEGSDESSPLLKRVIKGKKMALRELRRCRGIVAGELFRNMSVELEDGSKSVVTKLRAIEEAFDQPEQEETEREEAPKPTKQPLPEVGSLEKTIKDILASSDPDTMKLPFWDMAKKGQPSFVKFWKLTRKEEFPAPKSPVHFDDLF